MTCWTLSRLGFLQIFHNKRAQQQKTPQNRQKWSDFYTVDGFKIARLCGFQNIRIFWIWGFLPSKNPRQIFVSTPLIRVNFKKQTLDEILDESKLVLFKILFNKILLEEMLKCILHSNDFFLIWFLNVNTARRKCASPPLAHTKNLARVTENLLDRPKLNKVEFSCKGCYI